MIVDVIGSSPAWPNPGQAHAGYLVRGLAGQGLLLDCGPGVLSQLRARQLLPIDAIVITHMHLDHWGDLVPWCWFQRRHPTEAARPQLWLPAGALDSLASFESDFGSLGMFDTAFVVNEYRADTPFDAAQCTVQAKAVAHYGVPSFGLRATGDATVSYSGDSAPCDALRDLASGADLFICEATLAEAGDDGDPRGHMTAAEATELAGPTRLLLAHRPIELVPMSAAETAAPGLRIEL